MPSFFQGPVRNPGAWDLTLMLVRLGSASPALWIRSDWGSAELQRRPSELHPKLLIRVAADVSLLISLIFS